MKKLLFLLMLSVATLVSCSSTGPTGDPEADGEAFTKEFLSACRAKSVDQVKRTFTKYYEFYKDRDPEDIRDFFDAAEDAQVAIEESGEVDEDEMDEIEEWFRSHKADIKRAEKKFERLYDKVHKKN